MRFPDEGFFHALREDSEDDLLRLVYADFLEDRGDDESSARAELIRVQIELTPSTSLGPREAQRLAQLTARQNELIARWQRVWLGEWADVLHGWTFRRGMVEGVCADASAFLDHAPDWFSEWPTLTVAKLTQAGDRMAELASSPWLAHLRGLDLSKNGIDASALVHLTSSRYISLLRALDLSDNPVGPTGASLLASATSAHELSELHLARCGLWHEGLLSLLARRPTGQVPWRRLDLSGNGLTRLGLIRLVDSPVTKNLESLDLAWNPLGDNGASALADSSNSAGLVDLGLCETGTGDAGVAALAASRNLTNLRSLDLRGHHCWMSRDRTGRDVGGIAELARSPLLGQIRRLLLAESGPSNGWTANVLSDLRPARSLNLQRNGWVGEQLRQSRYLMPSQLLECDLEELWWLGDTRNRERLPSASYRVVDCIERFPELLEDLGKTHGSVLRLRYGVDETPRSLGEIGEHLGLTLDVVRQIEKEALSKLEILRQRIPFDVWYA